MPGVFSLAVADSDRYRIMVAGAPISNGAGASGYADGEFLKLTPQPQFILVKGTDGSMVRSKTNDVSIEIVLTLLQSSGSNAYLSGLLALDTSQPNGAGIGSFVLEDLSGTTLVSCSACWIETAAEITLDRGATARAWHLRALADIFLVGSN